MVSRAVPYHKLLSITTTFQTAVTLNCVCRCGGESGTRVFQAKLTELQADQPAATPPKPSSRFRPRASQTPRTDSGTSTLDSNPSPPSPAPPLPTSSSGAGDAEKALLTALPRHVTITPLPARGPAPSGRGRDYAPCGLQ